MSINNTGLYNLYKNNLVWMENNITPLARTTINFLQKKNQKNIENIKSFDFFILLNSSLPVDRIEELDFLHSIINACKINFEKVLLINQKFMPLQQSDFDQMKKCFLLIFDISPQEIFITKPIQNFIEFSDTQRNIFLFCPPLQELKDDLNNKTLLWEALKKCLNIS